MKLPKIYLDIGAHVGETTRWAMRYPFELIYCFEPARLPCEELEKVAETDPRVHAFRIGFEGVSGIGELHDPGSVGASLFPDKPRAIGNIPLPPPERILLQRASDWFSCCLDEKAAVKINCEGAEVAILEDLLESGEISKIASLMIAFDCEKIPSQKGQREGLIKRLKDRGIPFTEYNTHAYRSQFQDWLGTMET